MEDLRGAFKRLFSLESAPACVGIFIDGLDEFATFQSGQLKLATIDEQLNLAALVEGIADSKHLNITVSNWPEKAFEVGFRDCSKLRLHELTYHDQEIYTADILLNHHRMDYLLSHQSGDNQLTKDALVRSIVDKSEGVFVWLRLITYSLRLALDECDSISDLEAILDKLPKCLDHLFDSILYRLHENHQKRGIEYIQITQLARLVAPSQNARNIPLISAIGFCGVHSQLITIINRDLKPIPQEDIADIIHKFDSRLKSTYGLLEMGSESEFSIGNRSDINNLGF
jgi:hypothetical protein